MPGERWFRQFCVPAHLLNRYPRARASLWALIYPDLSHG